MWVIAALLIVQACALFKVASDEDNHPGERAWGYALVIADVAAAVHLLIR